MSSALVNHLFATDPMPAIASPLFEYVVAGNGLFVRAQRDYLRACIQTVDFDVRGLPDLDIEVELLTPPIPEDLLVQALGMANVLAAKPVECLFHFSWNGEKWLLEVPEQEQSAEHCKPKEFGAGTSYARAIVELHSHHSMEAEFSPTDDEDETGFRIFGVMGRLGLPAPAIRWRVGVYGHSFEIPCEVVVAGYAGLTDCVMREALALANAQGKEVSSGEPV